MRTFDRDGHPLPPYKGGNHLVSLRRPGNWYIQRVCTKGKSYHETNVKKIMEMIVDAIFGQDELDEEEILRLMNLDCMVNREAEHVREEMAFRIESEILAYFPRIGAELPRKFYALNEMDLLIDVPPDYEDQRGYFF